MFDDFFAQFNDWFSPDSYATNGLPEDTITSSLENNFLDVDQYPVSDVDSEVLTPTDSESEVYNDYSQDVLYPVDNLDYEIPDYYTPEFDWSPDDFDGWGCPMEDAEYWQQQEGGSSCAVVAQLSVYESITGNEICETDACNIAEENGWFDPQAGTVPEDVGKLLEELGIPTSQSYDATLDDIAEALERGDKVIVGLDANEIWYPLRDATTGEVVEQPEAGHAVWVTGIDPQPDGSIKIILNDSGTPDGQMKVIDSEDFLNAWEDFSNFLVVADAPDSAQSLW